MSRDNDTIRTPAPITNPPPDDARQHVVQAQRADRRTRALLVEFAGELAADRARCRPYPTVRATIATVAVDLGLTFEDAAELGHEAALRLLGRCA